MIHVLSDMMLLKHYFFFVFIRALFWEYINCLLFQASGKRQEKALTSCLTYKVVKYCNVSTGCTVLPIPTNIVSTCHCCVTVQNKVVDKLLHISNRDKNIQLSTILFYLNYFKIQTWHNVKSTHYKSCLVKLIAVSE